MSGSNVDCGLCLEQGPAVTMWPCKHIACATCAKTMIKCAGCGSDVFYRFYWVGGNIEVLQQHDETQLELTQWISTLPKEIDPDLTPPSTDTDVVSVPAGDVTTDQETCDGMEYDRGELFPGLEEMSMSPLTGHSDQQQLSFGSSYTSSAQKARRSVQQLGRIQLGEHPKTYCNFGNGP